MSGSSELLPSGRAIKQEEDDVPQEGLSTGQAIKEEPPLDHGCLTEAIAVLICTEENMEEESDSGQCDDIPTGKTLTMLLQFLHASSLTSTAHPCERETIIICKHLN